MAQVVIFSRPNCTYCKRAKEILLKKSKDISFEWFEIVLDKQTNYEQARNEMILQSQGKTTVPQILINGSLIVGGFTGLKELDDKGELNVKLMEKSERRYENSQELLMEQIIMIDEMDF